MISSENFSKKCDYILDHVYPIKQCERPKRIYVSGEKYVFEQVLHILKSFSHKYELVYHHTDYTFDRFKFESIKPYVSHVYSENCEINHPLITQLPIGFADGKYPIFTNKQKRILCYVNLNFYNDKEIQFVKCRSIRFDCLNYFNQCSFATIEKDLDFNTFMDRMSESEFIVCPMGYGLDTHRFYEACAAGAVPIVMSSGLDSLYEKFGAIIVDSWEMITEDFLKSFIKKPINKNLFKIDSYLKNI